MVKNVNVKYDLSVSKEKLDRALYMLEREGYHNLKILYVAKSENKD